MDLWCSEKFINMAEQILGSDVATHPVWNLRVKPPQNAFNPVPWHQGLVDFFCISYFTFLYKLMFQHRSTKYLIVSLILQTLDTSVKTLTII